MSFRDFLDNRLVKCSIWMIVLVSAYLLQPFRAVVFLGESMSPTYKNYEFALGTTDTTHLKRGDVVVIEGPDGIIVKRVAYLQGDWIDRYRLGPSTWEYSDSVIITPKAIDKVKVEVGKAWVPGGYIFVLGDNSSASIDSRQLGAIPISSIRCVLLNPKAING